MDMVAYRPIQRAAAVFHIQHLELAPEGWRQCVEKIAEGISELIGQHAYCVHCGGVIEGVKGHRIDCLTMVARRILAHEPLLHARLRASAPDVYVRLNTAFPDAHIGVVHATVPPADAAPAVRTGTNG